MTLNMSGKAGECCNMSVDGSVRYQVTKSVSLQSSPFYMPDLVLFAVTWA